MILKNRVINSTDKEERELTKKINIIINEAQKSQNEVDAIIKEVKLSLENKAITENEKVDYRIKENLFGSMINKYKNTCMRFQKEENDIKKIIETKLVRAAEIAVNQELTEEQKRVVIEEPQMIQKMYAAASRAVLRRTTAESACPHLCAVLWQLTDL